MKKSLVAAAFLSLCALGALAQSASLTATVNDNPKNAKFQQVASVVLALAVRPAKLVILTTSLPDGQVGVPYLDATGNPVQLQATGGVPPYTWAITSGALPPGLSLDSATGVISGTPTAATIVKLRVGGRLVALNVLPKK